MVRKPVRSVVIKERIFLRVIEESAVELEDKKRTSVVIRYSRVLIDGRC
jgi:hypothetical protein